MKTQVTKDFLVDIDGVEFHCVLVGEVFYVSKFDVVNNSRISRLSYEVFRGKGSYQRGRKGVVDCFAKQSRGAPMPFLSMEFLRELNEAHVATLRKKFATGPYLLTANRRADGASEFIRELSARAALILGHELRAQHPTKTVGLFQRLINRLIAPSLNKALEEANARIEELSIAAQKPAEPVAPAPSMEAIQGMIDLFGKSIITREQTAADKRVLAFSSRIKELEEMLAALVVKVESLSDDKVKSDIAELQDAVANLVVFGDTLTAYEYCANNNLDTGKLPQRLGISASAICRDRKVTIRYRKDAMFGPVGVYPKEILDLAYTRVGASSAKAA